MFISFLIYRLPVGKRSLEKFVFFWKRCWQEPGGIGYRHFFASSSKTLMHVFNRLFIIMDVSFNSLFTAANKNGETRRWMCVYTHSQDILRSAKQLCRLYFVSVIIHSLHSLSANFARLARRKNKWRRQLNDDWCLSVVQIRYRRERERKLLYIFYFTIFFFFLCLSCIYKKWRLIMYF